MDKGKETAVSRFAKDVARYFPAALVPAGVSVLGSAIFTRIFTPETYGLYSLALAISSTLVIALSEWVGQPVLRYYAEYERRGRKGDFVNLVSFFGFTVGFIVFVVGMLLALILRISNYGSRYLSITLATVTLISIQCICGIVMPLLAAQMKPAPYRRQIIISTTVWLVVSIIFVFSFGRRIEFLLWSQAIAVGVTLPYVYFKAGVPVFYFHGSFTLRESHLIRRIVRYGVPIMFWFLVNGLLTGADRYVIQFFRGAQEVGVYSVNYGLVGGITGLINAPIMAALGPVLYRNWSKQRIAEVGKTMGIMTELYSIIAIGFLGIIVVAGRPLESILIGAQFRSGEGILVPVYIGNMLWGVSHIGHKGLEFHERTRQMVWNALAAIAVNIGLNILLVPLFGYMAAAYTTLVSYLVYAGITWVQARSIIPWEVNVVRCFEYGIYAAVACLVTKLTLSAIPIGSPLFVCILETIIFGGCYGGLLTLKRRRLKGLLTLSSELPVA